jgi:hypothetical protein
MQSSFGLQGLYAGKHSRDNNMKTESEYRRMKYLDSGNGSVMGIVLLSVLLKD